MIHDESSNWGIGRALSAINSGKCGAESSERRSESRELGADSGEQIAGRGERRADIGERKERRRKTNGFYGYFDLAAVSNDLAISLYQHGRKHLTRRDGAPL